MLIFHECSNDNSCNYYFRNFWFGCYFENSAFGELTIQWRFRLDRWKCNNVSVRFTCAPRKLVKRYDRVVKFTYTKVTTQSKSIVIVDSQIYSIKTYFTVMSNIEIRIRYLWAANHQPPFCFFQPTSKILTSDILWPLTIRQAKIRLSKRWQVCRIIE